MKNLFKFLSLSVLAAFIAIGCANTSGDAVSINTSSTEAKAAVKTITLVATGDAEAIKFPTESQGISASIVAGTIGADTFEYYLFYTNKITNTTTLPTEALSFTASSPASNVGTVPLTIEDGYYEFKLYATQDTPSSMAESDVLSKALFLGKTEADLRTSTDTVSFYLSSDTLTGSANVSLKLMTSGWSVPDDYTVTAGITKKTDGTAVGGAATSVSLTSTVPDSANFTRTGVTAGTYNFEVTFTKDTKSFVWSDTIIIAPNHDIEQIVKIPDVIDLPPAAPTAFNATFKDPDSLTEDKYKVQFDWAATATVNELYFQIELLEIPSSAAWTDINSDTSTAWDNAYRTTLGNVSDSNYLTTLGKDFYGNLSQGWVAGSLRKNNNTIAVELPLGKRYLARICAVNDAGNSAYAYVDFDNTDVPAALTTGYAKFYADSKVINRYRLTYNLLGGTVTPASGSASTADIVEYRTQNTVANTDAGTSSSAGTYKGAAITSDVDDPTADIWCPAYDTTTYTSLVKNSKSWTSWKIDSSSSATKYPSPSTTDYNPEDYTGCDNLVLYASYSPTTASVNILDDTLWTIGIDNIAASGTGVTATDLASKYEIALNLATTGAGTIAWTGSYTSNQNGAGVVWSEVTYTIQKTGETTLCAGPVACTTSSTGFTASTDLSAYLEGKYLVTFNAYAPHKTEPYTCTVLVVITSN